MTWLREAINDSKSGLASSKRITMLMAALTLSISTLIQSVMVFWRPEIVPSLTTFGLTLGAMAGSGYVFGKQAEKVGANRDQTDRE